jgi:UDP-N-acetylglucosamine:LPS N-acetylglucosamine transferase
LEAPRILIFSADIGEGHDLPARLLADAIRARRPDAAVTIVDSLRAAGRVIYAAVRDGTEKTIERHPRVWEAQYYAVTRVAPIRGVASVLAYLLARGGLGRAIDAAAPHVIVSTYPGANEVLGRMHRRGEITVPMVSAVTDLAALRFWAHPDFDLHLTIHEESEAEVRALAGPRTRIVHASGMTDPEFLEPRDRGAARRDLGLPVDGRMVMVSGGGWGVGDLEGALRDFAAESRVRPIGFTDRMSDYLAAADVLVHATAGLTVLEAQIRGTRVISYGWGLGHIRRNNRAYRRFGLADVASTPSELEAALRSALASPREPDLSLADLPSGADLVLELAAGS